MNEVPLMQVKSRTGSSLVIYGDRAVIKRKGLDALAGGGHKGDTVFYYKDLTGIDYKKPTMLVTGYIHFIIAGTVPLGKDWGPFGTYNESLKDSNTYIFAASTKRANDETEKIYKLLLEKIDEAKSEKVSVVESFSAADEIAKFKNLFDQGVISEYEFEEKKRQLLNL